MLEHLDDPERALDVLAGLARPWLIASVPREPLWRALNLARLSYVGELGNTPGHLNHWSKRDFVRFLTRRFEVVEVRSPTPWTMVALPRTIAAFMRRLRQSDTKAHRARPGVAAIVTLGVAWGLVMHQMGWAQMAHFDQVQAFYKGQTQIDQWHWNTNDKAWVDGHFYSVKSPGMAALTTPLYDAIEDLGGDKLARAAVNNAEPDRSSEVDSRTPSFRSRTTATTSSAGMRVQRVRRGVDADRLGTHAAGGGDPRDPPAARGALGRRPFRTRLRHRRRDHPRPGDRGDDLRRGVLLARDLGRLRVRGLLPADEGEGRDPPALGWWQAPACSPASP